MTPSLTLFDVAHFRSCHEGGGQQISPRNRSLRGVGIAVRVTRRPGNCSACVVSCIGIWSVCTRTISRFPGKTGNGSDSCIGIWSVCTRTISRFPGKTGNGSDSRPRRLARPTGLPRSSQTQVSEVFGEFVRSLLQRRRPSVKHSGGVRSRYRYRFCRGIGIWSVYHGPYPTAETAPSACAFQDGVEQTTAQHQNLRFGLVSRAAARTIHGERPPRLSYGSDRLTMRDLPLSLARPRALLHNR